MIEPNEKLLEALDKMVQGLTCLYSSVDKSVADDLMGRFDAVVCALSSPPALTEEQEREVIPTLATEIWKITRGQRAACIMHAVEVIRALRAAGYAISYVGKASLSDADIRRAATNAGILVSDARGQAEDKLIPAADIATLRAFLREAGRG